MSRNLNCDKNFFSSSEWDDDVINHAEEKNNVDENSEHVHNMNDMTFFFDNLGSQNIRSGHDGGSGRNLSQPGSLNKKGEDGCFINELNDALWLGSTRFNEESKNENGKTEEISKKMFQNSNSPIEYREVRNHELGSKLDLIKNNMNSTFDLWDSNKGGNGALMAETCRVPLPQRRRINIYGYRGSGAISASGSIAALGSGDEGVVQMSLHKQSTYQGKKEDDAPFNECKMNSMQDICMEGCYPLGIVPSGTHLGKSGKTSEFGDSKLFGGNDSRSEGTYSFDGYVESKRESPMQTYLLRNGKENSKEWVHKKKTKDDTPMRSGNGINDVGIGSGMGTFSSCGDGSREGYAHASVASEVLNTEKKEGKPQTGGTNKKNASYSMINMVEVEQGRYGKLPSRHSQSSGDSFATNESGEVRSNPVGEKQLKGKKKRGKRKIRKKEKKKGKDDGEEEEDESYTSSSDDERILDSITVHDERKFFNEIKAYLNHRSVGDGGDVDANQIGEDTPFSREGEVSLKKKGGEGTPRGKKQPNGSFSKGRMLSSEREKKAIHRGNIDSIRSVQGIMGNSLGRRVQASVGDNIHGSNSNITRSCEMGSTIQSVCQVVLRNDEMHCEASHSENAYLVRCPNKMVEEEKDFLPNLERPPSSARNSRNPSHSNESEQKKKKIEKKLVGKTKLEKTELEKTKLEKTKSMSKIAKRKFKDENPPGELLTNRECAPHEEVISEKGEEGGRSAHGGEEEQKEGMQTVETQTGGKHKTGATYVQQKGRKFRDIFISLIKRDDSKKGEEVERGEEGGKAPKGESSQSGGEEGGGERIKLQSLGKKKANTLYNNFLESLKHPSCKDVIEKVKHFIVHFHPNESREKTANRIHRFISETQPFLLKSQVYENLSKNEMNVIVEGYEKFILQKLYLHIYRMIPEDKDEDEKIYTKIKCLQWIELKHLEISEEMSEELREEMGDEMGEEMGEDTNGAARGAVNGAARGAVNGAASGTASGTASGEIKLNNLRAAQNELLRIQKMKAPNDKLIMIRNCCRIVTSILYSAKKNLKKKKKKKMSQPMGEVEEMEMLSNHASKMVTNGIIPFSQEINPKSTESAKRSQEDVINEHIKNMAQKSQMADDSPRDGKGGGSESGSGRDNTGLSVESDRIDLVSQNQFSKSEQEQKDHDETADTTLGSEIGDVNGDVNGDVDGDVDGDVNGDGNRCNGDGGDDDLLPCADEVLPLLIYVIIKTNPPELISNIAFIQNFRHPSHFVSEEAYSFTQFCSSVEFIKELGKTTFLNISENDYRDKVSRAEKFYLREVKESNKKLQEVAGKLNDLIKVSYEKKVYGNIINRIEKLKLNLEYVEDFNSLTVANLATLFEEYKTLVRLKNDILKEAQEHLSEVNDKIDIDDGTILPLLQKGETVRGGILSCVARKNEFEILHSQGLHTENTQTTGIHKSGSKSGQESDAEGCKEDDFECKGVKLHNCGRRNFLHIPNVGLTKAGINHVNKECDVRKCNVMVSCHDNSHIFRKRFLISLDEKMNIKDMKEHIEKIHGIPITFQELLYENKPLDDNITIEHLNKGKKIKLLNLCLTTILPHIFSEDDTEGENEHEEEGDESSSLALSERRKIKKLQNKLKYYGYLTLLKEYKKLLHKVEENNSLIRRHDIIESYKAFDIEFKKVLHNNNINFEKVLKEIDMLKNITKKKLLLRLQVDYPLMSSSLIMRIKQLVRFYYLGDINSPPANPSMKFCTFSFFPFRGGCYFRVSPSASEQPCEQPCEEAFHKRIVCLLSTNSAMSIGLRYGWYSGEKENFPMYDSMRRNVAFVGYNETRK
ncbi:vacuolar protein sorting-associated protein 9, putative (VPS9) [Plasmodium ovale curtisi]|uniref:Vacuolar protein sorting-associated protein 9, putative (VPS9) n=1 Tax=Plasmodium ovale curtisi TaxID=864141 RepID=A0A1A8VSG4_PLAOA|nr:vacuolar protein sorting-associated protein 9, putative (VPS9) [Plasmodium ovale curtisi]